MHNLFLIGTVKFYDNIVNHFGRIVDDVRSREYNFKYENSSTSYFLSCNNNPVAGDIVKYKLMESNRKGQYRAVEVSKINCITNEEYNFIVEILKDRSSDEIISGEFLAHIAQIATDEMAFSRLCSILKYYYVADFENLSRHICNVFQNLTTEYKYHFLVWNERVKRSGLNFITKSLPNESLFTLIDEGYSCFYDTIRKGVLTVDEEKLLLQHALKNEKLDARILLNIFSRWVCDLPKTDPVYSDVIQTIKRGMSPSDLYELIKGKSQSPFGDFINRNFIIHLFDKSFFLKRDNNIDDLKYIFCLDFNYEEKEELIDAIKLPVKDKLSQFQICAFFTKEEYEQYKTHATGNLDADELVNLWLLGNIDIPFSIEDLNSYICSCSNPADKIDSIISSDKLDDNKLNELVTRYCSQLTLTLENINWCINNKGLAKLLFSVDELLSFIINLHNPTNILDSIVESRILDEDQTSLLLSKYVNSITLQKGNVEWCISHKKDIKNNKLVCENLQGIENTINWVQSDSMEVFDDQYLSYFHYLSDVHQMMFLRKYIELKKLNLTQITIGKLEGLISIKKDIDINVYIIVYSLCKLRREQQFISNNELYEALAEIHPVSGSIGKSLRELETSQLFDRCSTRFSLRERPESYRPDNLSCVISIDSNRNSAINIVRNYRDMSEKLKRCIPKEHRKYDPVTKEWSCDNMAYSDVWSFARLETSAPATAWHRAHSDVWSLAGSETSIVVCGGKAYEPYLNPYTSPQFCEGVEYPDKRINKTAYWCIGNSCLMCNIQRHDDYNSYTLYDFIYILNLDKICHDVDKMIRYFYSNINWFSSSISHLYCRECGRILSPKIPSTNKYNYTAHAVTHYECTNELCGEYKKVIYLNHCFMPRCHSIVDSRESQKCSNGFVICKNCGVCCGSSQFERKYNAGLGIPKIRFHFDNKEFYCPKCGTQLSRTGDDTFECQSCSTYKLTLIKLRNNEIVTRAEFCENSVDNL